MKKMNFLKFMLTLAMAFVLTEVSAQFVAQDAAVQHGIDTTTIGQAVPYFVAPDLYFNPSWVGGAAGADVGNVTSSFAWTVPTVPVGGTATSANANANYIEYTFTGAIGTYGLSVLETASTGCDAAAPVTMNVLVIEEPAVDITYVGSTGNCGTLATQNVTLQLRGVPPFHLVWTYREDNIESDASVTNLSTTSTAVATPLIITNADLTETAPGSMIWNYTIDAAKDFTVQNSKTTRYTYTVTSLTGRISRKSDYLDTPTPTPGTWDTFDYYANIIDLDAANGAQASVVVEVNPAPVTGPIYHISNMWAN